MNLSNKKWKVLVKLNQINFIEQQGHLLMNMWVDMQVVRCVFVFLGGVWWAGGLCCGWGGVMRILLGRIGVHKCLEGFDYRCIDHLCR